MLFEVDGENALEVALQAPNTLVNRLEEGQPVDGLFPSTGDVAFPDEITDVYPGETDLAFFEAGKKRLESCSPRSGSSGR